MESERETETFRLINNTGATSQPKKNMNDRSPTFYAVEKMQAQYCVNLKGFRGPQKFDQCEIVIINFGYPNFDP